MRCRVHRLDVEPTCDQAKLGRSLNGPAGEAVAIVPNVTFRLPRVHRIDFLRVVERAP